MKQYNKLFLFALVGLIAVFLGFFAFSPPTMLELYKNYSYWFITISCILWIISIIEPFAESNKTENSGNTLFLTTKLFLKNHWVALFLSLFLMILAIFACKPDFRILADETNLLSVSQSLYNSRETLLDCSSFTYRNGAKDIIIGRLDKRPVFFPYLLSIIHVLTGYRPENIFILNFIIGFLSLFLIYYLIQLIYGRFWGINGVVILVSYPLFVVYAASAGFDVFNMMCSLVFFICLYKFIKNTNAKSAEVLLLWLPLIAQSRYESVLSLIIVLPLVFYLLPKEQYEKFSYRFVVFPLLLVSPAWLRQVTNNPSDWQMQGGDSVFSIEWLWQNINNAISFFITGDVSYGVIPLISILALIGCIFFIWEVFFKKTSVLIQKTDFLPTREFRIFWIAVFLFYILHAIVKLSFKLCDFTDVLACRHAIIFLPLLIIMALSFLVLLKIQYSIRKIGFAIACLFLMIVYWSDINSLCGTKEVELFREFKFTRDFLEKNFPNKRDYMILSREAYLYTPLGYNSVYTSLFNDFNDLIKGYYNNKYCSYYLVFQTLNSETGLPFDGYELPKGLKSEILLETQLKKGFLYRIYRCVPYNNNQSLKEEK